MATIQPAASSLRTVNLTPVTSASNEGGFIELTRRLPADELALLHEGLSRVTGEEVHSLVVAMNRGDWKAKIFEKNNYPHIALKAFQMGEISEIQFGTIMFYWMNSNGEIKEIPLFTETGDVNPVAKDLLRQTLLVRPYKRDLYKNLEPGTSFLTESQLNDLLEEMRHYPPLERYLFLKEEKKIPDIVKIIQQIGINVFYQTDQGVIIPSAALVQAFLDARYGEKGLKAHFVLGFSTPRDISESISKNRREVVLRFPGTTITDSADGKAAPGWAITYHDIYHLIVVSALDIWLRNLLLKIGDFSQKYYEQNPTYKLAQRFYELIIDMEYVFALDEFICRNPGAKLTTKTNFIFWGCITGSLLRAKKENYLITEDDRRFIEALIAFIPMDRAYAEGHLFHEHEHRIDETLKEVEEKLNNIDPNNILSRWIGATYEPQRKALLDLKNNNVDRVIVQAWNRRLEEEKRMAGPYTR